MNHHDIRLIEIGQKEGYAKAVKEIVACLREEAVIYRSAWAESVDPRASAVADYIEAKFGTPNVAD